MRLENVSPTHVHEDIRNEMVMKTRVSYIELLMRGAEPIESNLVTIQIFVVPRCCRKFCYMAEIKHVLKYFRLTEMWTSWNTVEAESTAVAIHKSPNTPVTVLEPR